MSEPPPQASPDELTFEQSLDQLERIIHMIEAGEVDLEQSLERYAEGITRIRRCRGVLDRAEQKIRQLTVDDQGTVSDADAPLDPDTSPSADPP